MFENLSDKLMSTLQKVRGQGKITESNIEGAIKEIRMSLLEADVNFKVVKTFLDRVKARAMGAEVLQSVTPGQQFTKIVNGGAVVVAVIFIDGFFSMKNGDRFCRFKDSCLRGKSQLTI